MQKMDNEVLERSPLHLLHRVGQCAEDLFQLEMSGLDLTPRQYIVLLTVSKAEGLSQTDLVERTGIDRSTMADLVRRMLKKGLLQRQRSNEDRRAYSVSLTEQGTRALSAAEPVAVRADDRLLVALPAPMAEEFVSNLNTIIRAFSADRPAAVPENLDPGPNFATP
jgi:DNA-binding MarR family transcriptional regulator